MLNVPAQDVADADVFELVLAGQSGGLGALAAALHSHDHVFAHRPIVARPGDRARNDPTGHQLRPRPNRRPGRPRFARNVSSTPIDIGSCARARRTSHTVQRRCSWSWSCSLSFPADHFCSTGMRPCSRQPPRGEFERYGMPGVRRSVGATQLLGGAGVLIGLGSAPLGAVAAAGLTVMMVLGLVVRFRIHDAPRLMVPAASLGAINAVLTGLFLLR